MRTFKSFTASITRKLAGGSFFFEEYVAAEDDSTVVIGSQFLGEVAIIDLDGTNDLIFRSNSFLVSTAGIDMSMEAKGFGLEDGGFFNVLGRGQGSIGISGYGGLVSVKLMPGEECIVEPR